MSRSVLLALLLVGCVGRNNVQCVDESSCNLASGGVCVTSGLGNQWCAYPDGACAGGLRFSDYDVGDGLAGTCVGDDVDAGDQDDAGSPDSANPIGWGIAITGSGGEEVSDVDADSAGNLYLTGGFSAPASFGGFFESPMGTMDVLVAKVSPIGVVEWFKRFGGTGIDDGALVVADDQGVVVTGTFAGSVDFGSGIRTAVGNKEMFVMRLNPQGQLMWVATGGGASTDEVTGLAIDASGNVYTAGRFYGTGNFGGAPLTPLGTADVWVAKYTSNGTHTWSVRMGGTASEDVGGLALVDTDIVVAGRFSGQMDLGGGTLTATGNTNDVFIARLRGSDGGHVWSQRQGGSGTESANFVSLSQGDLVVTGSYSAVATFGTSTFSSVDGEDAFVWKLGADGTHRWARGFGAAGSDVGHALVSAANGDLVVVGNYRNPFAVDSMMLPAITNGGTFFLRLHGDSNAFGVRGMSSTLLADSVPVVDGDLIVAGAFIGLIDFFGHMLNNASNMGEADGFLVRE
jgi:hypothetical protein